MRITCEKVELSRVSELRELHRKEAACQIVRDSSLPRGFSDAYLLSVAGQTAAYGSIRRIHDPGTLSEFFVLPAFRDSSVGIFQELLGFGSATHIETQTNLPWMIPLLEAFVTDVEATSILFEDAQTTSLTHPNAIVRKLSSGDVVFPHHMEPVGDWVIESNGAVVATGGYFGHYNPPYVDLYMEVEPTQRQRGLGSFLLQQIKKVARQSGKTPAARCDPENLASRRCLERAGFRECGVLLCGTVRT